MKHKWTLFTFSRGDFKTLERYLNEQVDKGWELEKTGIFAKWKRTERRDLSYCVDLAKPKQDREDRLDYVEFCAEGGWELAGFASQIYIFKSLPGSHAIPIQTDPELEKKNYNRYYIWNTILSVLVLVLCFGFWMAVAAAAGGNGYITEAAEWFYNGWMDQWMAAGLVVLWPVWALWGLWKLVDFSRAIVMGRTGKMGDSPRWVMWVNGVLAFLSGVAGVLWLLCNVMDAILIPGTTRTDITIFVLCIVWAAALLYRALGIEKELFKRERRRYVTGGVALLVLFALLVVARATTPYGEWSTYGHGEKSLKGIAKYEQTMELPLVHGEDLGLPFELGQGENVYITHELTPAGEFWELMYLYGDEKNSRGFLGIGSDTTTSPTLWQAKQLMEAKVSGLDVERHAPWPEGGLAEVEIPWADEAWYGECRYEDGEAISILVLRVGKQVTRLSFPIDLMTEERLSAIRGELEK